MYKKTFRKPEMEHRRLDSKPKDRGDHTARRIIKITKNKANNEYQIPVVEAKNLCDTLRKQIENKDLGEYLVKVEQDCLRDRGDAKIPQSPTKLEPTSPKKVAQSKYMIVHANNPYGIKLSEKKLRKIQEKMLKEVKPLDIDKRRKLYRMYTFRRPSEDSNVKEENGKVDSVINTGQMFHIRRDIIEENLHEESFLEESMSEYTRSPARNSPDRRRVAASPDGIVVASPDRRMAVNPDRRRPVTEAVQTDIQTLPKVQKREASKPQSMLKNRKHSPTRHKRKPIIRTLMTRKGDSTKIYKAVSFVEQKKKAPLKIHIADKFSRSSRTPQTPRTPRTPLSPRTPYTPSPTYSHKSKNKASSQCSTNSTLPSRKRVQHKTSPSSIKKLVLNRKFKGKSRRVRHASPEIAVAPPLVTEVAKWAPQSVNEHTKPYYEAWVNTTLTAISGDNEKMRKEKERIIQQMQERMDYHNVFGMSEEDLSDEKYTGRIKVTHR